MLAILWLSNKCLNAIVLLFQILESTLWYMFQSSLLYFYYFIYHTEITRKLVYLTLCKRYWLTQTTKPIEEEQSNSDFKAPHTKYDKSCESQDILAHGIEPWCQQSDGYYWYSYCNIYEILCQKWWLFRRCCLFVFSVEYGTINEVYFLSFFFNAYIEPLGKADQMFPLGERLIELNIHVYSTHILWW